MNKKPRNKWITLISIPAQMGTVIFLFAKLGFWLDVKYKLNFKLQPFFVILGVFLALYSIYKQIETINKSK